MPKFIIVIAALACIGFGIYTIVKRRATPWNSEDSDHPVEGFRAIVAGCIEVAFGLYLLHDVGVV